MSAPPEAATFLGRFHPVMVHLPIGLIVLLFFFELLRFSRRFRQVGANAGPILALAAPLAIVTAVCGWLLSWSGGYDQRLLNWHKWTGVATAAFILVASLFYLIDAKKAYRMCIWAAFGILVAASHFGGSLTHGSDYLTQYAPKPLRYLMGAKATATAPKTSQGRSVANPQAWADVVRPILADKCVACHGPEKSKGKLRLDSLEMVLKGGEAGPAVMPGKSAQSEMVRRLLLPVEHDDHMPPDGKPQPTADEIALLKWWIDAGVPDTKTVAELQPPQSIANLLAAKLGTSSPPAATAALQTPPRPLAEVLPVAEQLGMELGASLSAISATDAWLQCNASVAGTNFGDSQLAKLATLGPNVQWLDLGGTAVSDAGLDTLNKLPNLTRLHLERTSVTDAGLGALTNLPTLEYLNLYGTAVSDEALPRLQALPRLRQIYLWQTKVTPEAAKAFAEARTDKAQLQKWREEIERLKARITEQEVTVDLGTVTQTVQATATGTVQVAINTACPVSGKPVVPGKTAVYAQKTVGFCCDDCKARFEQNPAPFLEKLGLANAPKSTP